MGDCGPSPINPKRVKADGLVCNLLLTNGCALVTKSYLKLIARVMEFSSSYADYQTAEADAREGSHSPSCSPVVRN
jgi:hypothetical protein